MIYGIFTAHIFRTHFYPFALHVTDYSFFMSPSSAERLEK